MADRDKGTVLVTGGAGYVGSELVPRLLAEGYGVKVLDLFLFGDHVLDAHPRLELVRGDIRDAELVGRAVKGCDAVVHLACISNDPSFDLDPTLGRSVNFDAFEPMVKRARDQGVRRFIYASSSSVYGVKSEPNVTEEASLEPLTDYSKYKAMCEEVLAKYQAPGFTTLTVRPATVCGYGRRQRLDVIVNILTNHAVNTGTIKIFGGDQKRPNVHIRDMVDSYVLFLSEPDERVAGKTYNVGHDNFTVRQLAEKVQGVVGRDRVKLAVEPTNDHRSYHVSSEKIARELGFRPRHSIEDAARDLVVAFADGRLPNSMTDKRYFNVATMKEIGFK
jgi:nucleoside-diphosphate-sugar epimerase